MSLTSSLAAPANLGIRSARDLLRGGSLQSMARAVGVVVGAGLLAASYQIAYEEGRDVVRTLQANVAQRRARNDAVVLALMTTDLPIQAQDQIRRSRDAFRAATALVTDEATPENFRTTIRDALTRLLQVTRPD